MIRDATPDDVPALVELGRQMAAESPRFSRLTYSPAKLDALFRMLIASPDGLLLVAESKGDRVGVMACMVADHWCAEGRMAMEFGLFIAPQHRGGMSAARMIRRYVQWARERGAADIGLGISTGVHAEQTASFYNALGLRPVGMLFEAPVSAQM